MWRSLLDGGQRFPGYRDLAADVPYTQLVGDAVQDRYGCTHAWFWLHAPAMNVAGVGQLIAMQQALVAVIDSLPDQIGQLQWTFSDAEDWAADAARHAAYRSAYRAVDDLRAERSRALLDATRDRTLTRTTTILVLSCLPQSPAALDRAKTFFGGSRGGDIHLPERTVDEEQTVAALQTLKLAQTIIEDVFERGGIGLRPMSGREIAGYLYRLWNPEQSRLVPLHYDYDRSSFNDSWMQGMSWHFGWDGIRVGDIYHGFVGMDQKPESSSPRIIERITTSSGVHNLRVTLTVRRLNKGVQRDQLRHYRTRSLQRMKEPLSVWDRILRPNRQEDPITAQYNVEAKAEVDEANKLIAEMRDNRQFQVLCQLIAHTWAPTPELLKRQKNLLLARFGDMQSSRGASETFSSYYILRSSLPGSVEPLPRWCKVKASMAADLVPINKSFETDDPPLCCFRSAAGGLVKLDLFDTSNVNAPMAFVAGSSGSGKSFLINQLIFQHLVDDALVIILDVGGSYDRLVKLLGGRTMAFTERFCFNPLQVYSGQAPGRLSKEARGRMVAALEAMMVQPDDPGGMMPVELINYVDQAVEACFEVAASRNQPLVVVSDIHRKFASYPGVRENLEMRLRPFVRGQVYGDRVDGPTTVDLRSDLLYIDMKGISGEKRLAAAFTPIMVNYIHDLVMASRKRRKILIFDELWEHILNERLMRFICAAWKTYRKENSVVIGSSQHLGADIADNAVVGGALIQNTDTWLMLQQGREENIRRTIELLGLTEGQSDILRNLKQRRGVNAEGAFENWRSALMVRGRGTQRENSGEIRIMPTPKEYWLATTDPAEIVFFDEVRAAHDGDIRHALNFCAAQHPHGLRKATGGETDAG